VKEENTILKPKHTLIFVVMMSGFRIGLLKYYQLQNQSYEYNTGLINTLSYKLYSLV